MKHFAVFLPMKDANKSQNFRSAHLAFLEELRTNGKVAANGKFADGTGGLVVYKAQSFEECETLVKMDPYVAQGARNYEIYEWEVVWADESHI